MFQIQNYELGPLTIDALEIAMGYFCLKVEKEMKKVLLRKPDNASKVAITTTTGSLSERIFGFYRYYVRKKKTNATKMNITWNITQDGILNNFEEKVKNVEDPSKQRTTTINVLTQIL